MPESITLKASCQRIRERLASLADHLQQSRCEFTEALENLSSAQSLRSHCDQGYTIVNELKRDVDTLSESVAVDASSNLCSRCAVLRISVGTQTQYAAQPSTCTTEASVQVEIADTDSLQLNVNFKGENKIHSLHESSDTKPVKIEAATDFHGAGDGARQPNAVSDAGVLYAPLLDATTEPVIHSPDVTTDTTPQPPVGDTEPLSVWGRSSEPLEDGEIDQGEPLSVADAVREAAESAQKQTGYVYDPTTGLYYDHSTGYYYDAENKLYYEPYSGTYYYWDEDARQYVLHSKVDFSQYSQEAYSRYRENVTGEAPPQTKKKSKKREKKKRKVLSEANDSDMVEEEDSSGADPIKSKPSKRKRAKQEHNQPHLGSEHLHLGSEQLHLGSDDENISLRHPNDEVDHTKRRKNETYAESEGIDKPEQECREAALNRKSRRKGLSRKSVDSQDNKSECSDNDSHGRHKRHRSKHKRSKHKKKSEDSEAEEENKSHDRKHHKKHKSKDRKRHKHHKKHKRKSKKHVENFSDSESDMDESANTTRHSSKPDREPSPETKHLVTVKQDIELPSERKFAYSADSSESSFLDESEESSTSGSEESTVTSASSYPPCIRAIVLESDTLEVGSLFIVTYPGGTIGRDKDLSPAIHIPDEAVSRVHCEIKYDESSKLYMLRDHGSQNGTFLKISNSQCFRVSQDGAPLTNLYALTVGGTTLELHIHLGTNTCEECEPGIIQAKKQALQEKEGPVLSSADKEKERRLQLKQIKKRYGLANSAYVDNKEAINNPNYSDKAAERRKVVGSDNPYQRDEAPASVNRAIPTKNKGHQMLAKMGWKEGESLGSSQSGITEPIHVEFRANQAAGLGSQRNVQRSLDDVHDAQTSQRWIKAQERFNKLQGGQSSTQGHGDRPARMQFVQGKSQTFEGDDNGGSSQTAISKTIEEPKQTTKTTVGTISWVKKSVDTKIQKPVSTAVFNVESSSENEESS